MLPHATSHWLIWAVVDMTQPLRYVRPHRGLSETCQFRRIAFTAAFGNNDHGVYAGSSNTQMSSPGYGQPQEKPTIKLDKALPIFL